MVSDGKMVQYSYRILQLIFLCVLWSSLLACDRCIEYSSIYIHEEDRGEIALFLINVVITMTSKKLDKGYKCPVYCGVDHKHIYWKEDETKKDHIQATNELYRDTRTASKE